MACPREYRTRACVFEALACGGKGVLEEGCIEETEGGGGRGNVVPDYAVRLIRVRKV